MNIRKTQKNHLREHVGVSLVPLAQAEAPKSDDPLVFWTRHATDSCKVDLNEFASGKTAKVTGRKAERLFTGRPGLIAQLMPAIEDALAVASPNTVGNYRNSLSWWWSLLDEWETSSEDESKQLGVCAAEPGSSGCRAARQLR